MIFQDLLKSAQFTKTTAILPIILGTDVFGGLVIKDLYTFPHMLIGGKTGTGKTVLLKNIYESLSYKLTTEQCKFIIIDTKTYDFKEYDINTNLLMPVITAPQDAFNVFKDITELISNRYKILHKNQARNITEYKNNGMPYIVIIIDEMADFIALNKGLFEAFIQTIAQKARTVGVHLVMATQQLSRDNFTPILDESMPVRICFKTTQDRSELCLGTGGAESLLAYGDMLYSAPGHSVKRIKCIK